MGRIPHMVKGVTLTQARLSRLLDPSHVFYRVAVRDAISRGVIREEWLTPEQSKRR